MPTIRSRWNRWLLAACCLLLLASLRPAAEGCPLCGAPALTFSEQYSKADAAVLVQWVGAVEPTEKDLGSTTYEIVEVARAPETTLQKGQKITLERFRAGKKGNLALILGTRTKAETIEWGNPLEVTETAYHYISQAPPPESPPAKRLAYFVNFLEYPDPGIAADAYQEFANAPYKDVVSITKAMPRDKLRRWIADDKTPPSRLNLYGLMLGLCGNDEDAALMEQKIVDTNEDFRLGIDGVMGGYLLLTGEKGLKVIENSKIVAKNVPFSEAYSARQAILFIAMYGAGRIPAERLNASLRLMLETRPELADLLIGDLARAKDWGLQKRLMELYGTEGYDIPAVKRAIARFMIASTKDVPSGGAEQRTPPHAEQGAKFLEQLRAKDPKIVGEAERYFFLN